MSDTRCSPASLMTTTSFDDLPPSRRPAGQSGIDAGGSAAANETDISMAAGITNARFIQHLTSIGGWRILLLLRHCRSARHAERCDALS